MRGFTVLGEKVDETGNELSPSHEGTDDLRRTENGHQSSSESNKVESELREDRAEIDVDVLDTADPQENSGQDCLRKTSLQMEEDLFEEEIEELQKREQYRSESCSNDEKKKPTGGEAKDQSLEQKEKKPPKIKHSSGNSYSDPKKSNPSIPGRPGRKKGDPAPIILNGENNRIVLDASQINFKDSPSKSTPKSNAKTKKDKASEHEAKTSGSQKDKLRQKKKQPSVEEHQRQKKTGKIKENKKDKDFEPGQSIDKEKEGETRNSKTGVTSKKSSQVKSTSKLEEKRRDGNRQETRRKTVSTTKGSGPIILNSENDKFVLDPSEIQFESSTETNIPSKSTKRAKESSTSKQSRSNEDKATKTSKVTKENKTKPKVDPQTQNVQSQDHPGEGKEKKKRTSATRSSEKIKISSESPRGTKQEAGKMKDSAVKKTKFKASYQKTFSPKKVFIDGRRIPAVELLHQKESNSSVKVFLFDEFLSKQECDGLIKAHESHVKALDQQPILCFDSIATLRLHIKDTKQKISVTPKDFIEGTRCLNNSFSGRMQNWMHSNWSYSTAFYPEESKFSTVAAARIEHAMGLRPENGGKFQITSYPVGKAYKEHTDCTVGSTDKRDRVATVLMYLNDAEDGGETDFPDLGIWVKPRKGRALVWNNLSPTGYCEPHSKHVAKIVKAGSKYILIRWYYYKSFQSLGKRPDPPPVPQRQVNQAMVMCDDYQNGSCRWYDEWSYEALLDYQQQKRSLH